MTSPALFEAYPTPEKMAAAGFDDLFPYVRSISYPNSKTRHLLDMAAQLMERFGGEVPSGIDELMSLPGVGRKSANLIMGDIFHKPAIVTDTHCIRLVNRFGLVDGIKDQKKVEMELWKLIPGEEGSDFCHRLVYHGREVCTARTTPHCDRCCLSDLCKKQL